MRFLQVDTLEDARQKLLDEAKAWLPATELLPLPQAAGRILAQDVYAANNSPHFRRSTVDGYAVIAKDVQGAGESIPSFLTVVGAVEMGKGADFAITSGQCAEIPTGGMLPQGADAVVMVEFCETFGDDEVAVYKAAAHGDHIIQIGDDMRAGALLLPKGKRLTPQDIGALAVAGAKNVSVFALPKIAFISTGDELIVPHYNPLEDGKIRESNTLSLAALAARHGYDVVQTLSVPDDQYTIKQAIKQAMEICDIVAVSGGSSQGKKDMTADIIQMVATPGVFTHGIAIKPGKPTILGHDETSRTLLVGLPGHPISAMTVFELLFGWLPPNLTGAAENFPIPAKLTTNVPGSDGKTTCCQCKLIFEDGAYTAHPIFSKSGLIATLVEASGYFLIDRGTEGLHKGDNVLVYLY
ncbi:MAG: molybdopterin molybdotransferase MoeA [Defluviitaleaceae bacterium]|nr:molybdopterin molybdotransferase MoeA [Defluviitaleaceae bacterium]